jgi:hypothetical protein
MIPIGNTNRRRYGTYHTGPDGGRELVKKSSNQARPANLFCRVNRCPGVIILATRPKGVKALHEIKYAVLERLGSIGVIKKE